jgi:hypothetical protein
MCVCVCVCKVAICHYLASVSGHPTDMSGYLAGISGHLTDMSGHLANVSGFYMVMCLAILLVFLVTQN